MSKSVFICLKVGIQNIGKHTARAQNVIFSSIMIDTAVNRIATVQYYILVHNKLGDHMHKYKQGSSSNCMRFRYCHDPVE